LIDVKNTLVRDIEIAFLRDMRSFLKAVNIKRPATDSIYDPVEETETGGTNSINTDTQGVYRRYKKYQIDDINIKYGDIKLTILQSYVDFEPQPNDIINDLYRVIKTSKDAADCFYTLQLRGI